MGDIDLESIQRRMQEWADRVGDVRKYLPLTGGGLVPGVEITNRADGLRYRWVINGAFGEWEAAVVEREEHGSRS